MPFLGIDSHPTLQSGQASFEGYNAYRLVEKWHSQKLIQKKTLALLSSFQRAMRSLFLFYSDNHFIALSEGEKESEERKEEKR